MDRMGHVVPAGVTAAAFALATRLPTATPEAVLAAVFAAAAIGCAVASCLNPKAPFAALAMAFTAALLVVPPGPTPWLDLPAAFVAAPALWFLHVLLHPHTASVPRLAGASTGRARRALRIAPWALLAIAVAAAPWLATVLLPDRIALASEVQGPGGPILLGALLALLALAAALAVRAARPQEPAQGPEEPP
jgi:hypothetical protein